MTARQIFPILPTFRALPILTICLRIGRLDWRKLSCKEASMAGITLLIVLQTAVLAADPASYEEAFKDAQTRNRPLLVLIGAPWCPGCQTMKQKLLPDMTRRGHLDGVSYATID